MIARIIIMDAASFNYLQKEDYIKSNDITLKRLLKRGRDGPRIS